MQQSTPGGAASRSPASGGAPTTTSKQGFLSSLLQRSSGLGQALGLGGGATAHAKLSSSPPPPQQAAPPSEAPDCSCCHDAADSEQQPRLPRSFKSAMFYEYLDAAEDDETRFHGNYHFPPAQPSWMSSSSSSSSSINQLHVNNKAAPRIVMEGPLPLQHPQHMETPGLWLDSVETSQASSMTYSRSSSVLRSRRESNNSLRALEEALPSTTPQGYTHGSAGGRAHRLELGLEDDEGGRGSAGLLAALPAWCHVPARAMARSVHVWLLTVQSPAFLLVFSLASLLLVVACLLSVVLIHPVGLGGGGTRHRHHHGPPPPPPGLNEDGGSGLPSSRPSSFVPLPVHPSTSSSDGQQQQQPVAPRTSASPMPTLGPLATGQYPDLFHSLLAKPQADVKSKVQGLWSTLFVGEAQGGSNRHRLYYETSLSSSALAAAYIKEPGAAVITSKGMALGLMACVQLGKRSEFDRLYGFVKAAMLHQPDGDHQQQQYRGLHASSVSPEGNVVEAGPDPEAEVLLATALVFAHHRWAPSFPSYGEQAQSAMDALQDPAHGLLTTEGVLRLGPQWGETRPSLQVPAYYEVWARFLEESGSDQAEVWRRAAEQSRQVLRTAANTRTGLFPDTTDLAGYATAATSGSGAALANLAVDWLWWRRDAWEVHEVDTLLAFLHSEGVPGYAASYNLDGSARSSSDPAPPALAATNAIAALAATDETARKALVTELWRLASPPPSKAQGSSRQRAAGLDALQVLLAFLHVSGDFRVY